MNSLPQSEIEWIWTLVIPILLFSLYSLNLKTGFIRIPNYLLLLIGSIFYLLGFEILHQIIITK